MYAFSFILARYAQLLQSDSDKSATVYGDFPLVVTVASWKNLAFRSLSMLQKSRLKRQMNFFKIILLFRCVFKP